MSENKKTYTREELAQYLYEKINSSKRPRELYNFLMAMCEMGKEGAA